MQKFKLQTNYLKFLSDTFTPVSVYLRIRDLFPNSILLESSDSQTNTNSFSFICFDPIASIKVSNNIVSKQYPNVEEENIELSPNADICAELQDFVDHFEAVETDLKFNSAGIYGYTSFDAIKYFQNIDINTVEKPNIPDIYYAVYKYVLAIDHFKNEAYLISYSSESEPSKLEEIKQIITSRSYASYPFNLSGNTTSNLEDKEFLKHVTLAKKHCQQGNVFQLVLSRRFYQNFSGDDFNVYRALRSINPSPYLFYFDYGNFKLLGSSPEAHLKISESKAEIHPIAGTFRRTGNDEQDFELAKKLSNDPKENSEHVMLVDLARNDLSKYCTDVKVEKYKEVQYFSHVIHLVSKVTGKLYKKDFMNLFAQTFPAGTLSGAPKHKALQLISEIEHTNRNFYGGAIGFIGFDGNHNHAIMIRSFLSKNNRLEFQAGAGLVINSQENNELQEINNKLEALKKALLTAEKI